MADMSDDLVISISTDLASVKRSLKRLEGDIGASTGAIEKKFQSLGRGIDKSMTTAMQQRIDAMTGAGVKATKEWTGALADQGKELERLRARYSPLFTTINNYKTAQADIRRAHALGAISADEMTSAMSRERQAALASIAAIKGRNAALSDTPAMRGGNGFQTANIAAQFQDIAVTSAMGMNPLQIALQQGTQLSMVMNDLKSNGQSTGAALATAFASVISPVSLVTIGLVAASAAAIQYFSGALSEGENSKETLQKQVELIRQVATEWGNAIPALQAYIAEQDKIQKMGDLEAATKGAIGRVLDESLTLLPQVRDAAVEAMTTAANSTIDTRMAFAQLVAEMTQVEEAVGELNSAYQKGEDTTDEMERANAALANLLTSSVIPATGDLRDMVDQLAAAFARGAISASDMATQAAAAVGQARMLDPRTWRGEGHLGTMKETRGDGFTALPWDGPTPEGRPQVELEGMPWLPKPKKERAARAPKKTADDQFRNEIQSIRDRTAALAEEMQLIGLSNEQQIARRTALEMEQRALAQVREEARKKGQTDVANIQLSDEKIAAINREAEAYARQAEALRVAQENNELVQSVTKGFVSDLMNGVKAADAFANALGKIADKLIDDVLNSILQVNGATGGGGGLLGSIFGLFGGGGKGLFPAAPSVGLYSDGGFTGPGGKYEPAGIVHKGEFVMNADATRRIGVNNLRMLQGYAEGGLVGAPRMPEMASRGGSGAVSVDARMTIDARGADGEAVTRLEAMQRRRDAELPGRVRKIMADVNLRRG